MLTMLARMSRLVKKPMTAAQTTNKMRVHLFSSAHLGLTKVLTAGAGIFRYHCSRQHDYL